MFRKTWLLVTSALLLFVFVAQADDDKTGDVLALTDSTFNEEISEHEISLVKFYAPWCGHCKRLAPDFEIAATKLKSSDPPVALVDVDCTTEQELCGEYEIQGYPTLKIFRNGQFSADYKGPRDAEGIVSYMIRQAGPAAIELNSLEDFEDFIGNEDYSVVGFFSSESALKKSFTEVVNSERDRFRFAYTHSADILHKTGFSDNIAVYVPKKLHNAFEPNEFKYEGNDSVEAIKTFLFNASTGLVGVRTFDNEFMFRKLPLVSVFYNLDYDNFSNDAAEWRNKVLEVANDYKDKVFFAVGSVVDYAHYLEYFGLKNIESLDKPLVIMLTADHHRFGLDKEFSVERLKQFVEDVLANKIEPYIRSEAVPETQGDLKVAVAKNFRKLILDADKDALVEFYAPWCGHCQQLAPKYEELATKLKDEDVIIAKMDVTANDLPPGFEVHGVPTIYWLPKDTKIPVHYEGARELKDLLEFVAEHSTDGLKGYDKAGEEKHDEL